MIVEHPKAVSIERGWGTSCLRRESEGSSVSDSTSVGMGSSRDGIVNKYPRFRGRDTLLRRSTGRKCGWCPYGSKVLVYV